MIKKSAKENRGESSVTERHFGVILEDIDSKLDLVVEGHFALDKKMEDFRKETNERFNEVDYKIEAVFDELHLIRGELAEKVDRKELTVLGK